MSHVLLIIAIKGSEQSYYERYVINRDDKDGSKDSCDDNRNTEDEDKDDCVDDQYKVTIMMAMMTMTNV